MCVCVPGFQCGSVSVSALSVCLSACVFHSMPVDRCMAVCLPVTVYAAVIVSLVVCMSMPTHFGFSFTRAVYRIIDRKHFIFSQNSLITA